MAAKNPWEDCEADRLPFYTPAQAAIRWCALTKQESAILTGLQNPSRIDSTDFPHYPCLFKHFSEITAAMEDGSLPYGRDGKPVTPGEHVAAPRRTVRHAALKEWIRSHHPADSRKDHMGWLFDETERATHSAITHDAYKALESDRDRWHTKFEEASQKLESANKELRELKQRPVLSDAPLDTRERTTLLCIIGALARGMKLDLSKHMKAGETVAAMAPELDLSARTIGDKLNLVSEAMDQRAG